MDELNQFMFFRSYKEAADQLTQAQRRAFYEAIINYALDGAEPKLTGPAAAAFALARPVITKSRNKAYNRKRK